MGDCEIINASVQNTVNNGVVTWEFVTFLSKPELDDDFTACKYYKESYACEKDLKNAIKNFLIKDRDMDVGSFKLILIA